MLQATLKWLPPAALDVMGNEIHRDTKPENDKI